MKKIICFCIVINILLLVGCQNSGGKVVKLTNNNYTDYLSVQLVTDSDDSIADAELIIESKDDKYIFEDLVVEAKFDWECYGKCYGMDQYRFKSGSGQIKVECDKMKRKWYRYGNLISDEEWDSIYYEKARTRKLDPFIKVENIKYNILSGTVRKNDLES